MKILTLLIFFLIFLLAAPVAADMHQLRFTNNCNQPVWVNVQGGPPGICDNDFETDPVTHVTSHVKCSACSMCKTGPNKLCNTSISTGGSGPICCPMMTDKPACNTGEFCAKNDCCPAIGLTGGKTYPCPGVNSTTPGCQNMSMTFAQIASLSGYNNATSGLHRATCSGNIVGNGGFKLDTNGDTRTYNVNDGWQGAWFGRTNCSFSGDLGSCETGDCPGTDGWSHLQCGGIGSLPPATKGEMNMEISNGIDYYDVSLVDGFNLPMEIRPVDFNPSFSNSGDPAGQFTCKAAGCLNTSTLSACPANLTYKPNGNLVACQDDCNRATTLHTTNPLMYPDAVVKAYCCPDNEYCSPINPCGTTTSTCKAWLTNPGNCKNCSAYHGIYPNGYPTTTDLPNSAIFFHDACPNAYSFTYDDAAASYTCNSTPSTGLRTKYNITFCAAAPRPTLTQTPAPSPATTHGENGGSDSGGSGVASAPAANAGATLTFSFNQQPGASAPVAVNQVLVVTGQPTEGMTMIAQTVTLGSAMQIQGRPVAGYLLIDPIGISPGMISQGTITFVVSPSWLTSHNAAPADIVLMRYHNNQWTELPTTFTGQSGTLYNFQAVTPGFSYFAITVKTQTNATILATSSIIPVTSIPVSDSAGIPGIITQLPVTNAPITTTTTVPPVSPAPQNAFPLTTAIAVIGAGVIVIGGAVLTRRWWIRRQNPALFKDID